MKHNAKPHWLLAALLATPKPSTDFRSLMPTSHR